MPNRILFGLEAQDKILKGVNALADAVTTTLGARGQNVGIAKKGQNGEIFERIIVHDGVTVAKNIELEDEAENFGAAILKEAAQKQVKDVGDGTTLSILLAQAILNESIKLTRAGVSPMSLREGLEKGCDVLVKEIEKHAIPIKSLAQKTDIAIISAENEELGHLVADTVDQMGVDGIITCEESKSSETFVQYQEGMQLDMGYSHQYYVTNPQTMEAVLENARLLITDKEMTTLAGMEGLLQKVFESSIPLVIIAPHIGGEAQELLLTNKLQGKLRVLTVRAPGFGHNQKSLLQDIAALTGARFIPTDAGAEFKDVTIKDLGKADYVTANKEATIIAGGKGNKQAIAERIDSIKASLANEEGEFDREKLKERLAKLTNGVAIIKVGGQTEIEMKERRERVLDAIEATKAAIREGIVPGGEIALLSARKVLKGDAPATVILRNALQRPFERLMENAGFNPGQMLERLEQVSAKGHGINVLNGQVTEMLIAGIIDPAAVHKNAIKNAVSVAIQLMTTGALVIPISEKKK